ncbi:MAG TPA: PAS domain-containing protein, partial [Polyangia bacterium]|nr:PAS domain-containing protein [Polyangia bacterium]
MNEPKEDEPHLSSVLSVTLDSISDGVQIIGFDWRYLYVNEAACRHGKRSREDLLGRVMFEVYAGIDETPMYRVLQSCMRDRTARQLDNEFAYPDGSRGVFQLRVEPCPQGIFVLSVDVTEHRRLHSQLQQAQKMDAVGKLAGGVAHDFNNLLTAMQGFTSFALESVGVSHAAAPDLQEVLTAIDRASGLTKQLLAFSRHQPVTPRVVDVNSMVGSVDKLLRRLLGEDISIMTKMVDNPWRTLIDPGSFEQLLVNLAVNARDAMTNGGRLTIETLNVSIDEPQALSRGLIVPPGEYIILAVSDDGVGMERALQEQIFEPFFTTKPVGKGT